MESIPSRAPETNLAGDVAAPLIRTYAVEMIDGKWVALPVSQKRTLNLRVKFDEDRTVNITRESRN